MGTVAYFGGSFNPPHSGHQRVILEALVHSGAEQVWVAPAYAHADGKKLANYNDRVSMCHKLTEPFKKHGVRVSRIEEAVCQRAEANGTPQGLTADVVDMLLAPGSGGGYEVYPCAEKVLVVVGSDVLASLPQWEGYDRLQKLKEQGKLGFFVVDRSVASESSTVIRKNIRDGYTIKRLVPPLVAEYIERYKLYKE